MALEMEYRRRLDKLIQEMSRSVVYWLRSSYRKNEPVMSQVLAEDISAPTLYTQAKQVSAAGYDREERKGSPNTIAFDRTPASMLRDAVKSLSKQWEDRFSAAASDLAEWFANKSKQRSTRTLQSILKKGGWTVKLKHTKAQKDILEAAVAENVALIKSIPQRYLTQVEGFVMRSVQTGNDLKQLTDDLTKQLGVERRRAKMIARDQTNKVNAALTRARQVELGIEEAIWMHSGGGKHPRPTHVKNDGKKYDVKKGWFDPHERKWIHPGMLINCQCVSRSVVFGFE